MEHTSLPLKLALIGDQSSGKTTILASYLKAQLPHEHVPTIISNHNKKIQINSQNIEIALCDTGGNQIYNKLTSIAYQDTDIFLVVFSVVDTASYLNAKNKWFNRVKQNNSKARIVFVGNKIDLRTSHVGQLFVAKDRAEGQIKKECGCQYLQCNGLSQISVQKMFGKVLEKGLGGGDGADRSDKKVQGCCIVM